MKKSIISIEVSRSQASKEELSYVIAMNEDKITDILYVQGNNTAKDLINTILSNIPIRSEEDIICYDANGVGIAISDVTINNEDFGYKKNMKPLHYTEVQHAGMLLDKAKEKLIDYAFNAQSDLNCGEFKRLSQEVNNLEFKQRAGKVVLAQRDDNIGHTRASCFLNALYVLESNQYKTKRRD